jgi:hypothetical protein
MRVSTNAGEKKICPSFACRSIGCELLMRPKSKTITLTVAAPFSNLSEPRPGGSGKDFLAVPPTLPATTDNFHLTLLSFPAHPLIFANLVR